jgi:hypothetical protein
VQEERNNKKLPDIEQSGPDQAESHLQIPLWHTPCPLHSGSPGQVEAISIYLVSPRYSFPLLHTASSTIKVAS